MAAARLRELCDIEGTRPIMVDLVRNKLLMKSAMIQLGIRVPQFHSLKQFMKFNYPFQPGKVVVKPIDGASSENVLVFNNANYAYQSIKLGATGIVDLDHARKFDKNEVPISGVIVGSNSHDLLNFLRNMFETVRVIDDQPSIGNVA